MRPITKASTNVSSTIRIVDSSDGTPETGVTSVTPGLALNYRREGAAAVAITTINDLALLTTAHTDGGILHIGNGYYRVDYQDAAFATGADGVLLTGTATGMVVIGTYHPLFDVDLYDAVRGGMTALPNAAADAAGGLVISDAGGLDIDTKLANTNEVTAARMGVLTDWIDGGRLDLLLDSLITEVATATGEPTQGAPGVSITRGQKIDYLFKAWRNKKDNDGSNNQIYADDGTTVDHKQAVSESSGTVTKAEWITGA